MCQDSCVMQHMSNNMSGSGKPPTCRRFEIDEFLCIRTYNTAMCRLSCVVSGIGMPPAVARGSVLKVRRISFWLWWRPSFGKPCAWVLAVAWRRAPQLLWPFPRTSFHAHRNPRSTQRSLDCDADHGDAKVRLVVWRDVTIRASCQESAHEIP